MHTIWNRFNSVILVLLVLMVGAAIAKGAFGGPLDPPGPPGSTLPQVEPRMPISSLPFTIGQAGSYFLTQNLSASSGSGITITTGNVEIDLNGFTLSGGGTSVDAIVNSGAIANVGVHNGIIQNWGHDGVNLATASRVDVSDLTASGNVVAGIETGQGIIDRCIVNGPTTGAVGVRAYGTVTITNCQVQGYGTGYALNAGGILQESTTKGAYLTGIYGASHSTISDCRVQDVGATSPGPNNGIVVEGTSLVKGCVIENIYESAASDYAINVAGPTNVITGDAIKGAQTGIRFDASATNTKVYGNTYGSLVSYFEGSATNNDIGPTRPYDDGGSWDQSLSTAGSDPCNTPRFKCVLNDAGVLDRETGLVWQQSPSAAIYDFDGAYLACLSAGTGGRAGWRVPTTEELKSLLVPSQAPPLPAGSPFANVNVASGIYWTSTSTPYGFPNYAYGVWMNDGHLSAFFKTGTHIVWCVRSGQGLDGTPTGP